MSIRVGLLTVELRLAGAHTLKDKRQVLQSLLDRIGRHFNVSVAEVAFNDDPGRAQIAVACVSNSVAHCGAVLDKVLAMIDTKGQAEVVAVEREEL